MSRSKYSLLILTIIFLVLPATLIQSPSLLAQTGTEYTDELLIQIGLGKNQNSRATYRLNYQKYPGLVAAFLYIAQKKPDIYRQVQYSSKSQGSYGQAFTSLPSKLYSLPDIPSTDHPQPGLAFWRNGSVLRSDILVLSNTEVGVRDQNNLVFFAELKRDTSSLKLSYKNGLKLLNIEAQSPEAKQFLSNLKKNQDTYLQHLEQLWQENLRNNAPEIFNLIQKTNDWKRDAFGYYSRTIENGTGDLPKPNEDLNITLEQQAFGEFNAQSFPVIISFRRDVLPLPFPYFIAQTPKGSHVEILCPPSKARSAISNLPTEYGRTRYQWLLDSYAKDAWVYLSFRLEID